MRRIASTLALLTTVLATPAFAGAAEDAFLSRLVGVWNGSGTLTGGENGTVDCSMTIRTRTDGVNFRGKCDTGKYGPQSFSGIVSYNDATGRYEATTPNGDIALGAKSGSSVIFTITLKGLATGTSVMQLSSSRAVIDTVVVHPQSSSEIKSHMVLTR